MTGRIGSAKDDAAKNDRHYNHCGLLVQRCLVSGSWRNHIAGKANLKLRSLDAGYGNTLNKSTPFPVLP